MFAQTPKRSARSRVIRQHGGSPTRQTDIFIPQSGDAKVSRSSPRQACDSSLFSLFFSFILYLLLSVYFILYFFRFFSYIFHSVCHTVTHILSHINTYTRTSTHFLSLFLFISKWVFFVIYYSTHKMHSIAYSGHLGQGSCDPRDLSLITIKINEINRLNSNKQTKLT